MAEALSNGQVHLAYEGEIAVLTLDNPPVNSSTDAVRRGILHALASLDVARARAVLLTGAGRNLMAGADLRELENEPTEPTLPQVTVALEACPLPVIALIKGQMVANYFMGLRRVHLGWRILILAYFLIVGGLIALAYQLA